MAGLVGLHASSASCSALTCSPSSPRVLHQRPALDGCSPKTLALRRHPASPRAQYRETNLLAGIPFRKPAVPPFKVVKAAGSFPDYAENSPSQSGGGEKDTMDENSAGAPIVWQSGTESQQREGMVVSSTSGPPLQSLSQDVAMGLVLREAAGTSWTTGSGLEGPTGEAESEPTEELKFPNLSKSPRRKMRVAFTCNVCGERTIRAINPLAYTDGTVFVQCKGCDVFHKLVDNLKLFHEMRGKIYRGHDVPWYSNDQPYNFLDGDYPVL